MWPFTKKYPPAIAAYLELAKRYRDTSKDKEFVFGPRCMCNTGEHGVYYGGAHHHLNGSSGVTFCRDMKSHDEHGWTVPNKRAEAK